MEKKLEEFKDELEKLVIKYNKEIHAGVLLNTALNEIIDMITETAITKVKGLNLIQELIDKKNSKILKG